MKGEDGERLKSQKRGRGINKQIKKERVERLENL